MENSESTKKAIKDAFEHLSGLTNEEFEKEMKNSPDTGIGRMIVEARECQGCKQLQAENSQQAKQITELEAENRYMKESLCTMPKCVHLDERDKQITELKKKLIKAQSFSDDDLTDEAKEVFMGIDKALNQTSDKPPQSRIAGSE